MYILGDVAMCHPQEATDILRMLPGTKLLAQGNHDIFNLDDSSFRHSFAKVKSYMDIVDNGRRYNAVADYLAFAPHTLDELIWLYD